MFIHIILIICALNNAFLEKIHYDVNDAEHIFSDYIAKFEKKYSSKIVHKSRFEIFKNNLVYVTELNLKYQNTSFGINQFSDLTFGEFRKGHASLFIDNISKKTFRNVLTGASPKKLDYRKQGYVTNVKDQKNCSASAIFSAIGAIEGQLAMFFGHKTSLSVQQGLDCSVSDCNGGNIEEVIQSVATLGGSVSEEDYPYMAEKGTCQTNKSRILVNVTGGGIIDVGEGGLHAALLSFGPVAVGISICPDFQHYTGGVFSVNCPHDPHLGHAMLAVGYEPDFWILKNSWGLTWGEKGYIRMAREKHLCGIGSYVVRAKVAQK